MRHGGGDVSVKGDARSFVSLDELVEYFRCSRGRLAARLRRALSQATLPVRATMTRYGEKYEISRADVLLDRETLPRPPSDRTSCRRIFVGVYKRFTKVRHHRQCSGGRGQRSPVSHCWCSLAFPPKLSARPFRSTDTFGFTAASLCNVSLLSGCDQSISHML